MAITFTIVGTNNNFSTWLTRTNDMVSAFANVVTVGGNSATGNAVVNGTFTANVLTTNTITSTGTLLITSDIATDLSYTLETRGPAFLRGAVRIDNLNTVTTLTSANATHYFLAANSATGNLYFSSIPSTFSVNTTFSANVTMSDRLTTTGNVVFNDRLTVSNTFTASNAAVFSNTVSISGNASFASNVSFTANVSFVANVDISQRLSVTNAVSFSNTLSVTGTTTLRAISANGGLGSAGQVLTSNGTSTFWSTVSSGGGTVTSVGSGNGLTGGPITGSGSLSVLANTGLFANNNGLFVNATSIAVGTLAVGRGGTGATTFTSGSLLRGNGTSALTAASAADVVAVIGTTNVANSTFALTANLATTATLAATANVANEVDNQNSASNLKLWTGSQAQYDAIGSKDANTLYFVTA